MPLFDVLANGGSEGGAWRKQRFREQSHQGVEQFALHRVESGLQIAREQFDHLDIMVLDVGKPVAAFSTPQLVEFNLFMSQCEKRIKIGFQFDEIEVAKRAPSNQELVLQASAIKVFFKTFERADQLFLDLGDAIVWTGSRLNPDLKPNVDE